MEIINTLLITVIVVQVTYLVMVNTKKISHKNPKHERSELIISSGKPSCAGITKGV